MKTKKTAKKPPTLSTTELAQVNGGWVWSVIPVLNPNPVTGLQNVLNPNPVTA
jgi:bacteriocin-like protein